MKGIKRERSRNVNSPVSQRVAESFRKCSHREREGEGRKEQRRKIGERSVFQQVGTQQAGQFSEKEEKRECEK